MAAMSAQFGLAGRFTSGLLAPPSAGARPSVRPPMIVRCAANGESSPSTAAGPLDSAEFDKKQFRHNLTRSDNYNRKGFCHKKETLALMDREYTSSYLPNLFNLFMPFELEEFEGLSVDFSHVNVPNVEII